MRLVNSELSGRLNFRHRLMVVSITVIVLVALVVFIIGGNLDFVVRPYQAKWFYGVYFSCLWFVGVFMYPIIVRFKLYIQIIVSALIMHLISILIVIFALGFFYYDDFSGRIINSWSLIDWPSYIFAVFVTGSAKAFVLGGWFFGVIVVGALGGMKWSVCNK